MAGCRHAAALEGEEEEEGSTQRVPALGKTLGAVPSLRTRSGAGVQVPAPSPPLGIVGPKSALGCWMGLCPGTGAQGGAQSCTPPPPTVCIPPDLQFRTWIPAARSLPGLV